MKDLLLGVGSTVQFVRLFSCPPLVRLLFNRRVLYGREGRYRPGKSQFKLNCK